jgi:hypothetical protein
VAAHVRSVYNQYRRHQCRSNTQQLLFRCLQEFSKHNPLVDVTWIYLLYKNEPLCDTAKFVSYGIPDGAQLTFEHYPQQVYVRNMEGSVFVSTGPWETIELLRFKIWKQYHIHVREKWLVLSDKPWIGLEDDRSLLSYGIDSLSIVEFRPRPTENQTVDTWR